MIRFPRSALETVAATAALAIAALLCTAPAAASVSDALARQIDPPVPDTTNPFSAEETVREEATLDVDGMGLDAAALISIDFDPWALTDVDIPSRQTVVETNRLDKERKRDAAATELGAAQRRFDEAEEARIEAQELRDRLEEEMQGFSITMWVLGDDGLQEALGSEVEVVQQSQPIRTATARLIERFEGAVRGLRLAEARADAAADTLVEKQAAFDAADVALDRAVQVERRFQAQVSARNDEIDRRTHEVLEEERDEVTLVRIRAITVRTPVGPPDTTVAVATPAGTGGQVEGPIDGSDLPVTEIEYVERTQPIPAIAVNAQIAGQVTALLGAAWSDGIELGGGGFRDREFQIVLRRAHCGTSGFAIFDMPAGECSPPTAQPGRSQHELGLAIDFTQNGSILTPGSSGFQWMQAHAAEFGLFNLPSEAWHWSTTGG